MAKSPDGESRRPITQYDLAERLGIGQKTVSRALAGEARVSPRLRARIEAAAAELGYRPNTSARSIRSQRFNNALFLQIVAKPTHRVAPGIIDGVAAGLAAAGRPLLIERLVLSDFAEHGISPRAVREAITDGLIIHADTDPPAVVDALLTASGLPVVWLNRLLTNDAVCPDDTGAATLMYERLFAAGHRRIAWVDQQLGFRPAADLHYSRKVRADAFQCAAEAARQQPLLMTPAYDPGESGHIAWLQARLRADRPTAIATYGSYEALAVLHAAGRLGLRVPEDISLMTVHHESLVAGLRIDVAALPTEAMGRAAAQMLIAKIDNGRRQPCIQVPFTLIPGATVVPPQA